jgi:hypothetical protein
MRKDTHEIQGLLATVHIGKDFFQFMTFQALGIFEGTHDIFLQRLFQLVFIRVGPPPAVLEKEPVPGYRVIDALTIFDVLSCAIGKRVVRRGVVANAVGRPETKFAYAMRQGKGAPYRYVIASTSTPLPLSTHLRRASRVALRTASTSFPSTRIVSIPYPAPRAAIPSPKYCSEDGVDMAKPLLRAMKRVGEAIVDANSMPA